MDASIWLWISAAITLVHTLEESIGGIWYLLPFKTTPSKYYTFQFAVLMLGTLAISTGNTLLLGLFVLQRTSDALITHYTLRVPGIWTAWLLILDSLVLICLVK